MTDDYAKRSELNGLGCRVKDVELMTARHDERIKGLELDTAEHSNAVWKAIDGMRESGGKLIVRVATIMGGIAAGGLFLTLLIQLYFHFTGK